MEFPLKNQQESLLEYVERIEPVYLKDTDKSERKTKGQFFTPASIGKLMADLFDISDNTIRLLDPGAGMGILTAAFCDHIIGQNMKFELTIDAYENDANIQPFLRNTLDWCKKTIENVGSRCHYNIFAEDFILNNRYQGNQFDLLTKEPPVLYDFIISNPPYYKLNKNSKHAIAMKEFVSGQPNIYAFFMAMGTKLLKNNGQMVFITPRSFCSGLYYKRFRKWFLQNTTLEKIHIFESRKDVFNKDSVLQENIILKATKHKNNGNGKVLITVTKNGDMNKFNKIEIDNSGFISKVNGESFIRIPSSTLDVDIFQVIDSWDNTLNSLGFEISTGPVVDFRAKDYLLFELGQKESSAPLLWMHNMQDMRIVYPLNKNGKPAAIKICEETKPLLRKVSNYVLLKRFTSKEQKRRLYSAVLSENEFPYEIVGIENHVNYIHKPKGRLETNIAFGIAAMLNTALIDNYFRTLNGSTQVNAVDIRALPLPGIDKLEEIGKSVKELNISGPSYQLDTVVGNISGIDNNIINRLYEETLKNSKSKRIYMSAFPNFREFKRYIDNIAWESEVWIEDNPDHMVHFNGPKFFAVYK